jgi:MFS family permease
MCLSQPIVARLSEISNQKSLVLGSILTLGIGSLVCESASGIPLLLTGRTIQGLGAGGLMVLSYSVYGDMGKLSGPKFLAAISLFVAAGTVSGPFVGAALSAKHHWVSTALLLRRTQLTTAPALDLSAKHTHVRGARHTRLQW